MPAVGRPGIHVERSLSADQLGDQDLKDWLLVYSTELTASPEAISSPEAWTWPKDTSQSTDTDAGSGDSITVTDENSEVTVDSPGVEVVPEGDIPKAAPEEGQVKESVVSVDTKTEEESTEQGMIVIRDEEGSGTLEEEGHSGDSDVVVVEQPPQTEKETVKEEETPEVSAIETTDIGLTNNSLVHTSTPIDEINYKMAEKARRIQEIKNEMETLNNEIHEAEAQKASINTIRVFNPNDVTVPSNLTVEEAETALKGTYLEYLAPTFVECEKEYGVNAIFLMSIAAHESDWGRSRRAVQDHNYTGFGVYSSSAEGINTATGQENIRMTANHLATNYLNPQGKYYHGVSVRAVHTMYCATGGWTEGVVANGTRLIWKVIDSDQAVVGSGSLPGSSVPNTTQNNGNNGGITVEN